ncbi:MAG: 1-phosphofructokinase family hexose kinase [Bacillota bacterium]
MILSIDLNPVLYKWLDIPLELENHSTFEARSKTLLPGEGGAYLSLVLSLMNEKAMLTGFCGGVGGNLIRNPLRDAGIIDNMVTTGEEIPERLILDFKDRELHIGERNPVITRDEISEFYSVFKEGLNNCDIVCLSGEYPSNMPEDMPVDIITTAKGWGRRVLVATGIENLKLVVDESPFLISLDTKGLESLTNLKLDYEGEIIKASQYLFQKDIEYVMVDLQGKGLLIMNSENGLSLGSEHNPEERSGFNFGGLLAGFSAGMNRKYDFETTAKLAYACGSLDFRDYNGIPDMTDIKALMNNIDTRSFHNL